MGKLAAAVCVLALALTACSPQPGDGSRAYGADPELPAPSGGLPVVNPAPAVGWADDAAPIAPEGFIVTRYFDGLDFPRWLYVLPNGDVLVAQSRSRPSRGQGLMGWIRNQVMDRAGALGESPDRITLLRDSNGDGVVDAHFEFAQDLNQPFGMALLGESFYVANTDAVLRFRYSEDAVRLGSQPETILSLPYREGDNGHWTRSLVVRPDGQKIYVAVGSASNIADYGLEAEEGRAAIWEMNPDGSEARIFASGLRNPVGMDFEPETAALWVTVNERDMLGDDVAPDYMTRVQEGGFYGWPFSYWGGNVDTRVDPQDPARVAEAITPDFALGAHTAALGLMFYELDAFPQKYRRGAFVAQHGSWNRSQRVGYRVVFVPFADGMPRGPVEDFLTGFLNAEGEAQGRPVGLAMDSLGALLVADDVGGVIWRVAAATAP